MTITSKGHLESKTRSSESLHTWCSKNGRVSSPENKKKMSSSPEIINSHKVDDTCHKTVHYYNNAFCPFFWHLLDVMGECSRNFTITIKQKLYYMYILLFFKSRNDHRKSAAWICSTVDPNNLYIYIIFIWHQNERVFFNDFQYLCIYFTEYLLSFAEEIRLYQSYFI